MKKIYELLLKSKYKLKKYRSEKSFTFEETNDEWTKQFTVTKFGKNYIVDGFEGTKNFIKTFKAEFSKYKEVVEYFGI